MQTLKAPFIYFGGKSKVAPLIWQRFGDVDNYCEPFAGSLAVLLGRPTSPKIETVNDINCVAPGTRILRDDLTWTQAGDLKIGDRLLAFDEFNGPAREGLRAPLHYRRWQPTTVTAIRLLKKPSYRLIFDDWIEVIASADHLWLGGSHRSGGRGWRWQKTQGMVAGREFRSWVLKLVPPIEREESWEAGWLGGIFDGEGTLIGNPGMKIAMTQNEGAILDHAIQLLLARGFEVSLARGNGRVRYLNIIGGIKETIRFLMTFRPLRLIRRFQDLIPQASLYGRDHQAVSLQIKEFLGDQDVVAIETDSHTFVAEGLASHNCYIANFWRATIADPEAVVEHCDWPVNEFDLHSRHRWLVLSPQAAEFRQRMREDPDYFDAKVAGWWCWGINMWIGSGWCDAGELRSDGLPREKYPWGRGIHSQGVPATHRPQLADAFSPGRGVHAGPGKLSEKRPQISGSVNGPKYGQGVHAGPRGLQQRLPHIGASYHQFVGRGVHAEGPIENGGTCSERRTWLLDWFGRLRDRLRVVRVCCGHWRRVCDSESVTTRLGVTGLFLDPPYPTHASDGSASRDASLYASDAAGDTDKLRDEVLAYCRERGSDPMMRICVAGYDTDGYAALVSEGWTEIAWKASGGYGNRSNRDGAENANAARERLWFSPHCLKSAHDDCPLFAGLTDEEED